MNKLENLLNFEEFKTININSSKPTVNTEVGLDIVGEEGKNNKQEMEDWYKGMNSKTKHTETGVDPVNEHLYYKVMDRNAKSWKENVAKMTVYLSKSINMNQCKDINFEGNTVNFTIQKRKYTLDKDGDLTVYRRKKDVKPTYDPPNPKIPHAGPRKKKKKYWEKIISELKVKVPLGKSEAEGLFNKIKDKKKG